jgi:hypothetical protein
MLAELMENATAFSPPHTRVLISATELRGGARLAIVDNGLGMSPERLAEENSRLTHRERLDLVPSEVLGLFVVGRLARRHGIEVTLTDTPGGGTTVWIDLTPAHLVSRVVSTTSVGAPSFAESQVSMPAYHTAEFAQVIAGSAARASVPGSQLPFDANVLERATRTLESGQSWNAFHAPARADAPPAIEAQIIEAEPVYDAEPVYSPAEIYQPPAGADLGVPVAGRVPASLPELPAAGPSAWNQHPIEAPQPTWNAPRPSETAWNVPQPLETSQPTRNAPPPQPETPQPMWNTPEPEPTWAAPQAPAIPHQRTDEDQRYGTPVPPAYAHPYPEPQPEPERGAGAPLRRRVPGSQLPVETGRPLPAAPPSQDDAVAARAAFDAFEAGVSRAQWDVAETEMTAPPSAGHAPLARRVPGATLPADVQNTPPPPAPAPPLDPDAARALMEQFEYGVALALNETQPEGQPR